MAIVHVKQSDTVIHRHPIETSARAAPLGHGTARSRMNAGIQRRERTLEALRCHQEPLPKRGNLLLCPLVGDVQALQSLLKSLHSGSQPRSLTDRGEKRGGREGARAAASRVSPTERRLSWQRRRLGWDSGLGVETGRAHQVGGAIGREAGSRQGQRSRHRARKTGQEGGGVGGGNGRGEGSLSGGNG